MSSYLVSCAVAFAGSSCSQTCRDDYRQLIQNGIGRQFYQCDCSLSSIASLCTRYKNGLLNSCFGGVEPTPPVISYKNGLLSVLLVPLMQYVDL
jgi:hypothetical protein